MASILVFAAFLFVAIGLATPAPTRVGMESKLAQGADIIAVAVFALVLAFHGRVFGPSLV